MPVAAVGLEGVVVGAVGVEECGVLVIHDEERLLARYGQLLVADAAD